MAELQARLRADLTAAMKARDELRAGTIRMALTAIRNAEVSGSRPRHLDDREVVEVLGREAKKRREATEAYAKAGRRQQAEREQAEEAVLGDYLPEQLSDAELRALVSAAVERTGATSGRAMGEVMKAVGPQVGGRADAARVAMEVRRALAARETAGDDTAP